MSYEVVIEPLGETIEVEEGQTLLDAALRAGVYLPHACGHGLCATCKIDVLEGEVEHGDVSPFALMDMERDEGKCLACCAVPTSDLVVEADIEEDEDALGLPVKDFVATVTKIIALTPRIRGILLEVEGEGVEFQPGQYINLEAPGTGQSRAFSIASTTADKNNIELNVCLVEGGEVTTWLHEKLEEGMKLNFTAPYGRFFVRGSRPDPMVFMAGGSGLSSPKSMILDLFDKGETREITLVCGARDFEELYYQDLFEALAEKHDNFHYIPVLSAEPEGSDWQGERGFVHEAADRHFDGKFGGMQAYMCGPPLMIDACISTLMKGRLFERDMFMENFFDQSSKDKQRSPLFKSI